MSGKVDSVKEVKVKGDRQDLAGETYIKGRKKIGLQSLLESGVTSGNLPFLLPWG